jgi:hypothetical protein
VQQLDKQMHKMLLEKHKRSEEIKADQATLDKIDATISTHIQPCLVSAACWQHLAAQNTQLLHCTCMQWKPGLQEAWLFDSSWRCG